MACFSVEVLINEVQEKLVSIGHFIYYLLYAQEVFFLFLYISIHGQDFLDIQYDYFVFDLKQC